MAHDVKELQSLCTRLFVVVCIYVQCLSIRENCIAAVCGRCLEQLVYLSRWFQLKPSKLIMFCFMIDTKALSTASNVLCVLCSPSPSAHSLLLFTHPARTNTATTTHSDRMQHSHIPKWTLSQQRVGAGNEEYTNLSLYVLYLYSLSLLLPSVCNAVFDLCRHKTSRPRNKFTIQVSS